jgi:hypothetical protein
MRKRLSVLLPIVFGAVTAAWAVISTDYNHQADFSRYHTYSWIGVRAGNTLWQDRIMAAVDSALAAKGWMKVPSGGDAAVSAFGRTRERDTLQTFYNGFPGWGWRGWWGTGTATTVVEPQAIGDLNVDIFDGKTKQLIWRGAAEKTLSSKPEKNEKKLEKLVEDMFKKFPPPEKG